MLGLIGLGTIVVGICMLNPLVVICGLLLLILLAVVNS